MSKHGLIVDTTADVFKAAMGEEEELNEAPVHPKEIKKLALHRVNQLFDCLETRRDIRSFDDVERAAVPLVFALGRLFLAYYLAWRRQNSEGKLLKEYRRSYWAGELQSRTIGTFFGKIPCWRTYLRDPAGGGVHPLDRALRLTADGFSLLVVSLGARLATLVSFDQVTALLMTFLFWSPSKTSVEKAVLGLGRYTAQWFDEAPPSDGDGDVLIIQIDSKATPTATDSELKKRRGKRIPTAYENSPRHRGRIRRGRRAPKIRRKKGDKSKNGKAATLVVMYTLKSKTDGAGRPFLLGPINRWVYASYAGKRHAFAIARREADKRGFTRRSKKTVQLVTDGDEDFETYREDFFPKAIHTLDIMHALEYVWKAGCCIYKEESEELTEWYEDMKDWVYKGKIRRVLSTLDYELRHIPKTGPGNKDKRKRLGGAIKYLKKRVKMMNYRWLIAQDLEIASGSVEGAVKHVIAKRFDNGGMRWIKERAEALLQLRCIVINDDWERFISFVQNRVSDQVDTTLESPRILTSEASPLPTFSVNTDKMVS